MVDPQHLENPKLFTIPENTTLHSKSKEGKDPSAFIAQILGLILGF